MRPIGYIKTPFTELDSTPRQPVKGESPVCTVVVKEEYMEALEGIEQFERIWLVFLFHRAGGYKKKVRARLDGELKGLFATRAPWRPNPIGISSLKLVSREGNILKVTGADLFDGTPILDIKPYLPE
jgi:tRNA-Thr(GGU) m(6)t(6)A37 methyltransferase TsaA